MKSIDSIWFCPETFWGGDIPELCGVEELQERGSIFQFGLPPNRIDLMNHIDGVAFREAWQTRVKLVIKAEDGKHIPLNLLSLENLIKNKSAAGRPKDQEDLRFLLKLPS